MRSGAHAFLNIDNEPLFMPERRIWCRAHDRALPMNRVTNDAELIRRVAAGDETALRGLFARHQTRIYRFILRLVGNTAVAEEVTNEVFLEVWRNAGKFEGASAAATWMLSIAHHRAVSYLRKRREEAWDDDVAGTLAAMGDDPE